MTHGCSLFHPGECRQQQATDSAALTSAPQSHQHPVRSVSQFRSCLPFVSWSGTSEQKLLDTHMLDTNRAANHYVLAVVLLCPRALQYAATLMIISLHSPSEKHFYLFSIPCVRVCIKFASTQLCVCLFVSDVLVVPQPIGIRVLTSWPIVAFGSVSAFMRHFLARRLPFSIISNRHAKARSWKRAPGWWISPKKRTPKFPGRVLYRTVSVRCTISAERQACEVQRLLLQFLGLFCHPWWNVRHRTARQLEASHQQRKGDRKYAEDFPLIVMVVT